MTVGEMSDDARKIYDDAEVAIAAITDIEHLLASDGCPLTKRQTSKYLFPVN